MYRIGVIGQSGEIEPEILEMAEAVGKEIASHQAVLLTGGTNGVMEAVSKGAKLNGGLVVGILPGDQAATGNQYVDIPITTGFGYDYRSLILVHSSDVIIMISGGNGTLGELSAAYLNRKPVVIVESSGGWAARVKEVAYDGMYLDVRKSIKLDYAAGAKEAVEIAIERAKEQIAGRMQNEEGTQKGKNVDGN